MKKQTIVMMLLVVLGTVAVCLTACDNSGVNGVETTPIDSLKKDTLAPKTIDSTQLAPVIKDSVK